MTQEAGKSKEQQERKIDPFNEWLKTSDGKNCEKPFEKLDAQIPYLRNRLWYAFYAGEHHGVEKERASLEKENEKLKKELALYRIDSGAKVESKCACNGYCVGVSDTPPTGGCDIS